MMMMMFKQMSQEQRAMSEVASAVEQLVQWNRQFNGKDVSRYLWSVYKAAAMWDLGGITSNILEGSIHEITATTPDLGSDWRSAESDKLVTKNLNSHRINYHLLQYFIRWKAIPFGNVFWEPTDHQHLRNALNIVQQFHRCYPLELAMATSHP